MTVVSTMLDGKIAVIQIDNPPVNATSVDVRRGLCAAIAAVEVDANAEAAVLACAGSTFVAGADIREFGKPPLDPHLSEVIARIEACSKPIVAAMHGTVLGGGLELALGCHYRVAAEAARMGLPESTLGVVPGAGGIPRLARLVGIERAVGMAADGKLVNATQACDMGLIDEIAESDVTAAARRYAEALLRRGESPRRTCDLSLEEPPVGTLDDIRKKVASTYRGQNAPLVCVDIAEQSLKLDLDASVAYGRDRFRELVAGPQSAALRHAFFSERVATKPVGLPEPDGAVQRVGVIGGGTMGTGIALCFLNAGIPVILVEQNEAVLTGCRERIAKTYDGDVAKGRIDEAKRKQRLDAWTGTTDFADLRDCDLVIEAVFEDMAVKQEVLAKIEAITGPDTLIATNTSYLNLDTMAAAMQRPGNVVGMHFFSPAHIMKLLENVRGAKSSPQALARIQALGKRLGKVAVMVGVSEGFVGNRMLSRRARECYFLLEEGATPEQVDGVLYDFGFPMGQFQLNDLAGLDVAWRARQGRLDRLTQREQDCGILDELVMVRKRLGQKSGAGFYRYDEKRKRSVDPDVTALIRQNAERRGFRSRVIFDEEILERCLYVMINEGARILEEGVATRPEEIDAIWMNGYGFPRHRGGPMYYADQIGLDRVLERIRHYAKEIGGQYWTPSPLLVELAGRGAGFYKR